MNSTTLTVKQFKEYLAFNKGISKYKNKRVLLKGELYDSKLERDFGALLERMKVCGEIADYERQVKVIFYAVSPKDNPDKVYLKKVYGEAEPQKDIRFNYTKIASYKVDFKVIHKDSSIEFIETKGFETPDWKIKWNLLSSFSDIKLTIVKGVKYGKK